MLFLPSSLLWLTISYPFSKTLSKTHLCQEPCQLPRGFRGFSVPFSKLLQHFLILHHSHLFMCLSPQLVAALKVHIVPPGPSFTPAKSCCYSCCCCSVAQVSPTPCDFMDCGTPGFPVLQHFPELAQTHVHWVGDAIQPSHPLSPLLLSSIIPSIRVFFNDSALPNTWPKAWSFSISPSNEYSELISFRIDWFDLLAVLGTLKHLLQHCSSRALVL